MVREVGLPVIGRVTARELAGCASTVESVHCCQAGSCGAGAGLAGAELACQWLLVRWCGQVGADAGKVGAGLQVG